MSNIWHTLLRQTLVRPRLGSSVLFALLVGLSLTAKLALITRLLVAWDAGILLYLILALLMFKDATPSHMRARAAEMDAGAWLMLFVTVLAAIVSVAAIVMELSDIKSVTRAERLLHLGLGIITITCSWIFVHTNFAVHYAHEFYLCMTESGQSALEFPQQDQAKEPDYWDFMYFAFVLGMTSQTSDVQITSQIMRRLALLHGVIAFFFNAALLALAVNTAAGVL